MSTIGEGSSVFGQYREDLRILGKIAQTIGDLDDTGLIILESELQFMGYSSKNGMITYLIKEIQDKLKNQNNKSVIEYLKALLVRLPELNDDERELITQDVLNTFGEDTFRRFKMKCMMPGTKSSKTSSKQLSN